MVKRSVITHCTLLMSMECKKPQSVSSLNYCLKCYRYIVSGNKKKVSLIDKKTGEIAHSITLGTVYQSTFNLPIAYFIDYHVNR